MMPGVVYLMVWLVVILCAHPLLPFLVPILPPPAISPPTCPSILLLLLPPSFPMSVGQRVERIGASVLTVVWLLVTRL